MDPPPMFQPQPPQMAAGAFPAAIATNPYLYSAFAAPNFAGIAVNPPNPPANPPYPEMITTAIRRLLEIPKAKTTKKEIGEWIAASYRELSPAYMRLVTEYLKRMTENGQLVRVGNSYFLPLPPGAGSELPHPLAPAPAAAAAASPAGGAGSSGLKKRGRPPKPKPAPVEPLPAAGEAQGALAVVDNGGESSARKRGRPRKVRPDGAGAGTVDHRTPLQLAVFEAAPVSNHNAVVAAPVLVNGSASLPKRRGRPRKDQVAPVAEPALAVASVVSSGSGRPRGRPRKNAVDVAAAPPLLTDGSRPRGRPRKNAVVAGGVVPAGMKRRGRPRGSVAGARKPHVSRSGRPLGRPRKYAQAAETQASDGRAREELTRKLEYMQLKVRNAVGLLKPHLINANIIDIMTALQDLEELATMDITVPAEAAPVTVPIAEPSAPPADVPSTSYAAYPVSSHPPVSVKVDTSLGMSG